eukprot:Stramenopile-MAST_4_protein_3871
MAFPTKRCMLVYRYCTYCALEVSELNNSNVSDEGIFVKGSEKEEGSGGGRIQRKRLVVRAAAWGHPRDGSKSFDVTDVVQKMIDDGTGDRLFLDAKTMRPSDLFGDPYPKGRKVLNLRTRYGDRFTEWQVKQGKGNRFKKSLTIEPPFDPWLFILHATYGHRVDRKCQYNVTEKLQARIDSCGGRYLGIPGDEDVANWFGDPYPGGRKQLIIKYEMGGWLGDITIPEAHGHVLEPLTIVAPMVTPQLTIKYARFGMLAPPKEQSLLKGARPKFVEKNSMDSATVSKVLQKIADINEGERINLTCKDSLFDVFGGDPCPNLAKCLYVEYSLSEHAGKVKINCDTSGHLVHPLTLSTPMYKEGGDQARRLSGNNMLVAPGVQLKSAGFGHPSMEHDKTFDITVMLQRRLDANKGKVLHIPRSEDLYKSFGDPCRGVFKHLVIRYQMPMWMQTLEVEGIGRTLEATLRIGWPGEFSVSPKCTDVALKTKSGQGWSTRWSGNFDVNALHSSRHEIELMRKQKIEQAHKKLQLQIAQNKRREKEKLIALRNKRPGQK